MPALQALSLVESWQAYCATVRGFPVAYATYQYFRSLGWVAKPGIKYGVDWGKEERGTKGEGTKGPRDQGTKTGGGLGASAREGIRSEREMGGRELTTRAHPYPLPSVRTEPNRTEPNRIAATKSSTSAARPFTTPSTCARPSPSP